MWLIIFALAGILATVGSLILPVTHDETAGKVENLIGSVSEGVAGGMMLGMVATAMLPEAFKGAGEAAGVYFVLGFVLSLSITCVEARFGTVQNPRPHHEHSVY
eukprot:TRINITY_DN110375_c0_g1_i1.p1 TRINITY_DN110375_c0_g1~~TRINITY_DN110375_c0_g1_i1.p1  ORF type:complete len:104 (-),score=20.15 TRINITY_DN110375_c0_g1_i1:212-523(-)